MPYQEGLEQTVRVVHRMWAC